MRKLLCVIFVLLLCTALAASVSAEGMDYESGEYGLDDCLLTAVALGVGIGLLVAFMLKGQLKSVHRQDQANAYVKPGSMQITQSDDHFLYSNVVRMPKQQNNSHS